MLAPDGGEITTWRQDYPYEERIDPEEYRARKRALQIELLKMQSWVKDTGRPGLSGVVSARIVRGTQESGGHRQRAREALERSWRRQTRAAVAP